MGCKSALQRYGALGLSALIVTSGSAFIAAAPASADPANPVTGIMITDPTGLVASVKHDGTNSTVHIGAAVTGKDDLAGVKFYYQSAGGQLTLINYDTTFPYSADWSAVAGTYTLKADAVTAGGTTLAEDTNPGVVVSDSTSSVHLTTGDGASIGEFHKQIVVRGTRSADKPALDVSANGGAIKHLGAGVAADDQTWSALVTLNDADVPDADSVPNGVTVKPVSILADATTSEESGAATVYHQVLTSLSVSAPSVDVPTGNASKVTITAKDQKGNPIADLALGLTATNGTLGTPSGTPAGTTDNNGQVTVDVTPTAEGAVTVKATPSLGLDNPGSIAGNGSFNAYKQIATSVVIAADPSKTVYAAFDEYKANTPAVTATVMDQKGKPFVGALAGPLLDKVTRINNGGDPADTAGSTTNGGLIAHSGSAATDTGSDTFNAWVEMDGVSGESAGDLKATAVKLNWAPAGMGIMLGSKSVTDGTTQAQLGNTMTYTLKYFVDGQAVAGRKVQVALSNFGSFPAEQPTGVSRTAPNMVTGTTDASGNLTFKVAAAGADEGQTVLQASDITSPAPSFTRTTSLTINWRTNSVALAKKTDGQSSTLDVAGSHLGATSDVPGAVIVRNGQLQDSSERPLANIDATISLDHGYFVKFVDGAQTNLYKDIQFSGSVANGGLVTAPASQGTSMDVRTDNAGNIIGGFMVSMARDAELDDDGTAVVTPKVTSGSGSVDLGKPSFVTSGMMNAGDLKIVSEGGAMSGFVGHNSDYTRDYRNVGAHLTDQFGNLVNPGNNSIDMSVSDGSISDSHLAGSYTDEEGQNFAALSRSSDGDQTVMAEFDDAPVTKFVVDPNTHKVTSFDTTSTKDLTDEAGPITWYTPAIAADKGATYEFTQTPGAAFRVGQTVSIKLTAKDQKDHALVGLPVNWFQAGPAAADKKGWSATNADGQTSYQVVGSAQGVAEVTGIVTEMGENDLPTNNELARGVKDIAFNNAPSLSAPSSRKGKGYVSLTGATRPGAMVSVKRSYDGGKSWMTITSGKANEAGQYGINAWMERNAQFKVSADGISDSAARNVAMVAAPALSLSSTTKGWVKANVAGNPGIAGQKVAIYVLDAKGGKHYVTSATADSKGVAHFVIRTTSRHAYKFVSYAYGNSAVNGAWSATMGITSK